MVSIATKYDHNTVVDDSTMTITWVRSDTTNTFLALLAQGHVETESVMIHASETKVVLLALKLVNEIETGIGAGNQQTPLHVRRCR